MANQTMTLFELRTLSKNIGLRGYSKYSKKSLIEFINTHTQKTQKNYTQNALDRKKSNNRQIQRKPQKSEEILFEFERSPQNKRSPQNGQNERLLSKEYKEYSNEFLNLRKEGPSYYIRLSQLGRTGKEGTVYLVVDPENGNHYAMKTFRSRKSGKTLEKEAFYQYLASKHNISPKIIEYNTDEKYIVMEILEYTLIEILRKQNGQLSEEQQYQILNIYKKLDEIGIMIDDANPLNLMTKGGKFYAIDYGLARFIDHKKFEKYPQPNSQLMPIGLLLWLKNKIPIENFKVIQNAIPLETRNKIL